MRSKSQWADVVFGAKFRIGQRVRDKVNLHMGEGVVIRLEVGPNKAEKGEVFVDTNLVYVVEWGDGHKSLYIEEEDRLESAE